jgi:hypothetical protein
MPIYEFYCPDNHKVYSFFARSLAYGSELPRCPDGDHLRMQKCVSGFAVTGRAKEPTAADELPDDPRMEAAMAEMEREMASMDEENPDPRKMGHLMRRMAELTGEKLPDSMEEMVGRLEAGEDPEKLEEEFGDLDDEMGGFGEDGCDTCGDAGDACTTSSKTWWRKIRGPRRDPVLYEMTDYL